MNRPVLSFSMLAPLLLSVFAACGEKAPPTDPSLVPTNKPVATAAPIQNHDEWNKMNRDQRKAYMKDVVMPRMREVFREYDGAKYAEVTCKTCHGKAAEKGEFSMPSGDLAALDYSEHFKKHREKDPKMLDFMMKRVVPEMAKLMAEPPFNPETRKGFGCHECHKKAE